MSPRKEKPMDEVITIKRSDLHKAFEHLETTKDLRDIYEAKKDELQYQKYLSEWIGMLTIICDLGLLSEQTRWLCEQIRKEQE